MSPPDRGQGTHGSLFAPGSWGPSFAPVVFLLPCTEGDDVYDQARRYLQLLLSLRFVSWVAFSLSLVPGVFAFSLASRDDRCTWHEVQFFVSQAVLENEIGSTQRCEF